MADSTHLISHPLEGRASNLSGVPPDSWMVAREDCRMFEKELPEGMTTPNEQTNLQDWTLDGDPITEDAEHAPQSSTIPYSSRQPTLLTGVQPADIGREALTTALEDGFEQLTAVIFDQIMNHQSTLAGIRKEQALKACWRILLSTDARVLRSLLEGNLAKGDRSNNDIRNALNKLRMRARTVAQPCIYGNYFTSNDGTPQTAVETHHILNVMERYADPSLVSEEDIDRAFKIDVAIQATRPHARHWTKILTANGYRRYLGRPGSPGMPQAAYIDALVRFVSGVRARLSAVTPEDLEKPFEPCFSEIGYTAKIEARLMAHKTHVSSNRLMNFFEATSMTLYGDRYRIRQYVLYLIWDAGQASVAEIIFTVLSNSFVGGGCGFSFCNPGISVDSVNRVADKQWQKFFEWAVSESPYLPNNQLEEERTKKLMEEEESLRTEIIQIENDTSALLASDTIESSTTGRSGESPEGQAWLDEQVDMLKVLSARAGALSSGVYKSPAC